MFLGNNFRGTNLTIPIHRGIINRKDDETQKKGHEKVDAAAGDYSGGRTVGCDYLTPARTGEDEPPASAHQMQAEYETEAMSG